MGVAQGHIERDRVELHWWLEGEDPDAPLVVCTHGGAMDHRMWDAQVTALAREYRILSYDLRGHGLSRCLASEFSLDAACEDLVALMDVVDAEAAVLVGHSVGATVSQLVTLRHPRRVRALIGIGASCATMPPTITARIRQAVNPLALTVLGQKRLREMFADMAGVNAEVKEYARQAIGLLDDEVFAAVMRTGFGRYQSVDEGYELGVPLLLLQGDQEPYSAFMGTTPRWVKRDGARLAVVPGAAHNANQDSPDFVNGQIAGFLAELPA